MLTLIASVIGLLVVGFVLSPFWLEHRLWSRMAVPERRTVLEEERDVLLRDLKDLEFDQRMGKVDEADYSEMRSALVEKTTTVLDELEASTAPAQADGWADWEIETEVLIARERLKLSLRVLWKCVCGRDMSEADKFCANCGAARPQQA